MLQLGIFILLIAASVSGQESCPIGYDYWPHQECNLYWQCNNGRPILNECPSNLYWNAEVEACDFQVNVPECIDGTRPPITNPPATTPNTGTDPPNTQEQTEGTTTIRSSTEEPAPETEPSFTTRIPPPECPPEIVIKIAHEEWCHAYYMCIRGDRQPFSVCANGLLFDQTIRECNLAAIVDCGTLIGPSTTPVPETTQGPIECPEEGVFKMPYPGNCTLYTWCTEGSRSIYRCPYEWSFDSIELECSVDAECNVR